VSEQMYDVHQPSASAVRCHGGRLREDMRKIILTHKADQEDGFPLFLLQYIVLWRIYPKQELLSHRNLEMHATIKLCLKRTSVCCSLLGNSQLNNEFAASVP
jgi:hypothetical protein